MAETPYVVDSNVLLRWVKPDHRDYPAIISATDAVLRHDGVLCYTSQNAGEFWNACTRPVDRNGYGLSPQETELRLLPDSLAVHEEWRKLLVTHNEDGRVRVFNTAEGAAADHTFRDRDEEAFHLIEPRTAGRGEVEIEVAVLSGFAPPLYSGALVRAVVVQNDVHVQIGRDLLLQLVEKLCELFAAMTRQATADDFAVQDIEGGK